MGLASEERKKNPALHPLPSQVFGFALATSFHVILSALSTIELKYEKIEGCEQST